MTTALFESNLRSLNLLHRGKVRDIYEVDAERLLIVQTDRLSAFDVILPTPVPGKGQVLTTLSLFWFRRLAGVIPNHLLDVDPSSLVMPAERDQIIGRAMVVRKLKPLPIEAIVRGYVAGSGWKEYQRSGAICGIPLPAGLLEADRLPRAIFTPSTKAPAGTHDENIPFGEVERLLGATRAADVREKAIALYSEAADYARTRGIIIADTKFEFGTDAQGDALSHRRGAHAGLVALLAPRPVSTREQPAQLRQAVRARLARDPALGQEASRACIATRCVGWYRGKVSRGAAAAYWF